MLHFKRMERADMALVLRWRTSEHVTKYMYTDVEDDMDKQLQWFDKISNDASQKYWIIYAKEIPIGLIALTSIDWVNKKATSGHYVGNLDYALIASRILPYLLNYVFFELGLNKLHIEVMSDNKNMLAMEYQYGFRNVGRFEQHIFKYGKFHDVEILEILAEHWTTNFSKYHRLQATFS